MHSDWELQREAKQALADALDFYQNDCGYARRLAVKAIEENRAAFWTSSTYSNAIATELVENANRLPITECLGFIDAWHRNKFGDASYLKTLIPLNEQASDELARAKALAS